MEFYARLPTRHPVRACGVAFQQLFYRYMRLCVYQCFHAPKSFIVLPDDVNGDVNPGEGCSRRVIYVHILLHSSLFLADTHI